VWVGRYREDLIQPDGKIVRKRCSIVLGTRNIQPSGSLNAAWMPNSLESIS
jgi:hypothetical protein